MAQNFLDQLPRVATEDLSDNKTCIVCLEEYGTTHPDSEAEEAVRLPCPGRHIVGLKCISSWFSPGVNNRTSCPCCRHEFTALTFPLQFEAPQPLNNNWQAFQRWRNQWQEFSSSLVAAGGTPELVHRWRLWFGMWHETAQTAAVQAVHPESNGSDPPMYYWTETLSFREYYHYVLRQSRNGFTMDILDGPQPRLTAVDEALIFSRLSRTGAFRGVLGEVRSREERWSILRSRGYVFDEEERVWGTCLY